MCCVPHYLELVWTQQIKGVVPQRASPSVEVPAASTRGHSFFIRWCDTLTWNEDPFMCKGLCFLILLICLTNVFSFIRTVLSSQVSALPTAISAAASPCGGFPGRAEAGFLGRDPKRGLKWAWRIPGSGFQRESRESRLELTGVSKEQGVCRSLHYLRYVTKRNFFSP